MLSEPKSGRLISLGGRAGCPEHWTFEQTAKDEQELSKPGTGEASRIRKRHLQGEIKEV